jgi:hypothetical protein
MSIEVMKMALEALECVWGFEYSGTKALKKSHLAIVALRAAIEQAEQESITVLPDGSAFAVMSWPLPKDHWLYAEREYRDGEFEPVELGKPILTHSLRKAVVSAVRYAIRGATNCGKDVDFDPDALVQNAVYALCGPYGQAIEQPEQAQPVWDASAPLVVHPHPAFQNATPQRQPLTQDLDAPLTLNGIALYPRQQPLTDEEIGRIAGDCLDAWSCARAIEAAHGIKGEA